MSRLWRYTMSQTFKVPKYSELSVAKIWGYVQECPDLLDYFPDLDPGKLLESKFLFKVMGTLRPDEMDS